MNTLTGGDLQGNIKLGDTETGVVGGLVKAKNAVSGVAGAIAEQLEPKPETGRKGIPEEFR